MTEREKHWPSPSEWRNPVPAAPGSSGFLGRRLAGSGLACRTRAASRRHFCNWSDSGPFRQNVLSGPLKCSSVLVDVGSGQRVCLEPRSSLIQQKGLTMATCPSGHKNPDNQRFCGECGAAIPPVSESKPNAGEATFSAVTEDVELPGRAGILRRAKFIEADGEAVSPGTQKATGSPSKTRGSPQSEAEQDYRLFLIAAIAASVGVMVGSVGPWMSVVLFTVNGLDWGNWGVTGLTLGAVACVAVLAELVWPRTPFSPRWALPVLWAVAVVGVACLTFSLPLLIRIMTIPKEHVFGVPLGAGVGWALWLLAFSSAVQCVAATIAAAQRAKQADLDNSWTAKWRWAAVAASAVIAVSGIIYFATNWEADSEDGKTSPSFPNLPSVMDLPSFSSVSTTPNYRPTATPPSSNATTSTSTMTITTPVSTLPEAVVGSSCRLNSTPTVDFDGVAVYCARVQYTDGYLWSRTPGTLPYESPDAFDGARICAEQTGRSYAYCSTAISQAIYRGDGSEPP